MPRVPRMEDTTMRKGFMRRSLIGSLLSSPRSLSIILLALCFATVALRFLLFPREARGALSPDIVISQVYGGGGNSGATFTNDFIELFNRGTMPVNISSWAVQYASSTGATWQKTDLTGTLAPGQYYLIQEAS